MEEILLAEAAIGLVEKLYPKIEEMVQKGDITPEQQLALHDRVDALRQRHRWSAPLTSDVGTIQQPVVITPTHADAGKAPEPNPPVIAGP
jgi:hypothetical protein